MQLLVAAAAIIVLCLFLTPRLRAPALLVALACTALQGWKVFPYTPLAPTEIRLAPPANDQLSFLAANVLMENREHEAVAQMIRREAPDVIFLMETDQAWIEALEPVLDRYDTVLTHPQDNHYGLVFATNLETVEAHLLDLGDADKPTLYAELKDRQGRLFRFVGLHAAPPVPSQDTDIRDAKTAYAAHFAPESGVPVRWSISRAAKRSARTISRCSVPSGSTRNWRRSSTSRPTSWSPATPPKWRSWSTNTARRSSLIYAEGSGAGSQS